MKLCRKLVVCLILLCCLYESAGAAGLNPTVWRERQALVYKGIARVYEVRVPATVLREEERVSLVLVLHGRGGSSRNAEKITGFTPLAVSENFIVVYPEGALLKGPLTWNAGLYRRFARPSHSRLSRRSKQDLCHGDVQWRNDGPSPGD